MSIFGKIKDAIFGKKKEAPPAAIPMTEAPASVGAAPVQPQPVAISEVDVEAQLDAMPGADKLHWRNSIVDLMKLIGLDASYAERKELAHEMGNTDYSGTAEDNIALHKQVMAELAKNGGKVPASMLD
ncbi:MAG: DUF3597 domain-containing protein [Parasphingorhabdus sp.]|nr:DUF3597 domain-containing protein [Parasphingorhabdus sp.]